MNPGECAGAALNGAELTAKFAAAQSLCQRGRPVEADALCAEILRSDPRHFAAYHLRGHMALQRGDYGLGITFIGLSLKFNPHQPHAHFNIGNAMMATGRVEQALQCYDRALALDGSNAHAMNNRGLALVQLGRLTEALDAYARLLNAYPGDINALFGRGNALMALHRFEEAKQSFSNVLDLDACHCDALLNRGVVLHNLRQLEAALADYERVLRLVPNSTSALSNSANVLLDLRRPEEALRRYEMAGAVCESANNLCGRALALLQLRLHEQAGKAFESALQAAPGHPSALEGLFRCRIESCDWQDFDSLQRQVQALFLRTKNVGFPLTLLLFDDPDLSLQCMRNTIAAKYPQRAEFAEARRQPVAARSGRKRDRIRVAYVSADFREHPVARLLAGVLERHDRKRFEILGVSLQPGVDGEFDRRLRRAFDAYLEVGDLTDAEIAGTLRSREVDIAVDLMGMTEGLRPSIFARGAAAVQVSYLGYAGTMGAPYIDYLVADSVVVPEEFTRGYDERIVRLPGCFLAYDDRREIGPPPSRRQAGLPEQGFVFCAFTQPHKINPTVFRAWMGLLRDVPGSVLWLREMGDFAGTNLRQFALSEGVSPHRLVFAATVNSSSDHLARQALADLYLDTLPYNAHSTACDALWAGVPVLTCAGTSFASRVAASALAAVGLPELVARNLEEYAQRGRELAQNPERLRAVRRHLSRQRSESSLFDTARYTRSLEAAYRTMHERAVRGDSPISFTIRN